MFVLPSRFTYPQYTLEKYSTYINMDKQKY